MLISPTFHNRSNTRHTQFGSVLFTRNAMPCRAFPTSTESATFPIPLTAMAREALGRQLVEAKATQPGPSSLATCTVPAAQGDLSLVTGLLGLQGHRACPTVSPPTASEQTGARQSPSEPVPPSPFQAILAPPPYMKRSISSQGSMRGPKVSASAKSPTFSLRNVSSSGNLPKEITLN